MLNQYKMDQIRTSKVRYGGYYGVDYDKQYNVDSAEHCANICVGDRSCKTWKYVGGVCSTSDQSSVGKMWAFNEKGSGGDIEYVSHYSMVQIIVFVMVMILFGLSFGNLLRVYFSK